MSKFIGIDTEYGFQQELIECLQEMFGKNNVEVHDAPVEMQGYQGESAQANIIIRKKNLIGRSYGDLGFIKEEGKYKLIKDDLYDFNLQEFTSSYATKVLHNRAPATMRVMNKEKNKIKVQVLR